ncbi:MAG: hypothetical protein WA874_12120 [Chryseosolibacter sp.]
MKELFSLREEKKLLLNIRIFRTSNISLPGKMWREAGIVRLTLSGVPEFRDDVMKLGNVGPAAINFSTPAKAGGN